MLKVSKKSYSAGDGIRTREGTHPLGPQPSAFDRSTTPACQMLKVTSVGNIEGLRNYVSQR